MKYNILGFYQPRAVELGLESNDLLVLRWFIDYAGTNKMRTMIIDNKIYYWINYNSILEELPILKISKQTLARKHFGNLVKANVLEHKFVNEGGSFSYYCYGINYDTLIYLQSDGGCVKNNEGMSKNTQGYVNSDIGGMSKNTHQINNILNNNNSIKLNIKENIKKKDEDYIDIFDFWNSKKIIEHRELNNEISTAISKALKKYSLEQIKTCIDRYEKVLSDQNSFFNYKWTLAEFLTRKNGINDFLDDGSKWANYCNNTNVKKGGGTNVKKGDGSAYRDLV